MTSKARTSRKARQPRKAQSSGEGLRGWWQGLPDKVKWLAALVAGAGLLWGAIEGLAKKINLDIAKKIDEAFESRCLTYDVAIPDVMPLSIYPSLHRKNFPYWFRITAENNCDEILWLTVTWKNPVTKPDMPQINFKNDTTRRYRVPPSKGERKAINFNPTIEILGDDFQSSIDLEVQWELQDENQKLIDSDTKNIEILPPTRYLWNLMNPAGDEVKKEWLLAFLANWVMTPSDRITEKVANLAAKVSNADIDNFMRHLYEDIFSADNASNYVSAVVNFPNNTELEIRTPDSVLSGTKANALEFALAFAAVAQKAVDRMKMNMSVALFVIPNGEENQQEKRFLVAWSTPQSQWKAIDISNGWKEAFDQNVDEATKRLNKLLEDHPKIVSAMHPADDDGGGIYVDEDASIFGLDFQRVDDRTDLRIHALPLLSPLPAASTQPDN